MLLWALLPLPSRQTLQSILSAVPFKTGINAHVFSTLKHSLQKMSGKHNFYCLMFDEMSIRENLHFSYQFDCIEGFEDLRRQSTTSNTANQALVFMVHDLRKKWK
jgi:hypothetical protein